MGPTGPVRIWHTFCEDNGASGHVAHFWLGANAASGHVTHLLWGQRGRQTFGTRFADARLGRRRKLKPWEAPGPRNGNYTCSPRSSGRRELAHCIYRFCCRIATWIVGGIVAGEGSLGDPRQVLGRFWAEPLLILDRFWIGSHSILGGSREQPAQPLGQW